MFFRNVQCGEAERGERIPGIAAPAFGRLQDLATLLEAVFLAHEALHGIGEQLLFFGEIEIHGRFLAGLNDLEAYSPRIIWEMILR